MLHRMLAVALVLACIVAPWSGAEATSIQSKRIQFAAGASSASVKGSIAGDRIIDYKLRARAGQTMSVVLETANPSAYFNVLPPGSENALFIGSTSGSKWTGALPADGEYRVRVYLMRSAARRNEAADFTLTVGVTGTAAKAVAADAGGASDATARAGQGKFDATGQVPCAQHKGQPMGQCAFGVARAGGGTATVSVTLPDGRKRAIFFEKGKAIGADLSQADGNMEFRVTKQADLYMIQAGDERYEIPAAVVYGG